MERKRNSLSSSDEQVGDAGLKPAQALDQSSALRSVRNTKMQDKDSWPKL